MYINVVSPLRLTSHTLHVNGLVWSEQEQIWILNHKPEALWLANINTNQIPVLYKQMRHLHLVFKLSEFANFIITTVAEISYIFILHNLNGQITDGDSIRPLISANTYPSLSPILNPINQPPGVVS